MDEAAELRRHIEEIEAKLGLKMMSRFRIKAHLPFPFLCDLVSHPKLLDAVEDLIGPDNLVLGLELLPEGARRQNVRLLASGFDILRARAAEYADRLGRHHGGPDRIGLHALSAWITRQGSLQP